MEYLDEFNEIHRRKRVVAGNVMEGMLVSSPADVAASTTSK